jgi:hypothetical protein
LFIFLLNICSIIENDFLPDILINPSALSIGAVASATIVSVNKLIPLFTNKIIAQKNCEDSQFNQRRL